MDALLVGSSADPLGGGRDANWVRDSGALGGCVWPSSMSETVTGKLKMKNYFVLAFVTALAMFAPVASFATGLDVSSVTTSISDAAAPIATIGLAVLVLLVGIKVVKWIRRAM